MYSIGELSKASGLSRSTLLYYDKIGLLQPSARSQANYRLYTQQDYERLQKVLHFRQAGIPLEAINELLTADNRTTITAALEKRLSDINQEISNLRQQQQQIVTLLDKTRLSKQTKVVNKAQWVSLLREAGMDDAAMEQWHRAFEREAPEAHTDFLQSLGIDSQEISKIKDWSKSNR